MLCNDVLLEDNVSVTAGPGGIQTGQTHIIAIVFSVLIPLLCICVGVFLVLFLLWQYRRTGRVCPNVRLCSIIISYKSSHLHYGSFISYVNVMAITFRNLIFIIRTSITSCVVISPNLRNTCICLANSDPFLIPGTCKGVILCIISIVIILQRHRKHGCSRCRNTPLFPAIHYIHVLVS